MYGTRAVPSSSIRLPAPIFMEVRPETQEKLGEDWIPAIYAEIRTRRTRAYRMEIPERENQAEILHTLLGIELKVGKLRLSCPDLSTARFLRVFARIGCRDIAIPYDITEIPLLADKLESAWHRTLLFFGEMTNEKSPQIRGKMRAAMIKGIREEIEEAGPGEMMPQFDRLSGQKRR